jgi:hypothetical protein
MTVKPGRLPALIASTELISPRFWDEERRDLELR